MYDSYTIWLLPVLIIAGVVAGWLGAWNEVRLVSGSDNTNRVLGCFLRVRAASYGLAFYLIFAIIAFCGGGLYASSHWQGALQARGTLFFLLPGSLQTLATGGMTMLVSGTVSLQSYARKYEVDLL